MQDRLAGSTALTALPLLVVALTALFAVSVSGQYPSTTSPLDGDLCSPPFGYRRRKCGYETLVDTTFDTACTFDYGPNVCTVTRTVVTHELEYRYRESCGYVYSHDYYQWIRQCNLICTPTGVCDESVNCTYSRRSNECCEGFTTRPPDDRSHQEYYYLQYYSPMDTEPLGCPVAVADSLLQCLELQGLTSFLGAVNMSQFFELLNGTGMKVTLFVPTNAAFEEAGMLLDAPDMLVGNHLVLGTVQEDDLVSTMRFLTLAGTHLHSTTVIYYDYGSSYGGYTYTQSRVVRFISGGRVISKEACNVPNGTLHIIDRVLMPGNGTIADVLVSDSRFSVLGALLDTVGILPFLGKNNTFRTLFAPTNEVIMNEWPPDLLMCLTNYMHRPLNNILLYHILDSVEYDSSLRLRQWLSTLRLNSHLRVHPFDNGTILLGGDTNARLVRIVETNIPTLNGVIHVVDGILMPPNFDYGMCQEFVPVATPPPPSPPSPSSTSSLPTPSPSSALSPFPTSSPIGSGFGTFDYVL